MGTLSDPFLPYAEAIAVCLLGCTLLRLFVHRYVIQRIVPRWAGDRQGRARCDNRRHFHAREALAAFVRALTVEIVPNTTSALEGLPERTGMGAEENLSILQTSTAPPVRSNDHE